MEFQISPLRGVGQVEFGMTPDEVRSKVGGSPLSFKRSPQATYPCDYFESQGTFFYYDSEGRLEAAEFSSPAQPTVENLRLVGMGFEDATTALSALDNQVEKEVDSVIAYQLGVSIYAPLAKDDPNAPVESVVAFRPGYYN